MLKVLNIECSLPAIDDTGEVLFKRNPIYYFTIEAPLYWWLDSEVVTLERSNFILPREDFKYCFDGFHQSCPEIQMTEHYMSNKKHTDRQLIQIMPLGTLTTAVLRLPYQQIVELCENFSEGEYAYHRAFNEWDNEQEWKDFCEELFKIRGIKELVRR